MIPYLLLLYSLALTTRRLLGPSAYLLAFLGLFFAGSNNGMFSPERIDHHGWQLALLALSISSIADPKRARGGLMLGVSTALSLAIGLEMIIYLALAGVAMVLFWVEDAGERERLRAYAVSLGGATAFCFLVFASNDNWHPVCDVLSPVWMTTVAAAALLLVAVTFVPAPHPAARLALVLVAGGIAGAVYVFGFPQCFGHRLEGIPPEADRLWLSHVSEARSILLHPISTGVPMAALPFVGMIGSIVAIVRRWGTRAAAEWMPVTLFAIFATALLFWQIRTAPSAEMLAVPGATYIALRGFVTLRRSENVLVRVIGPVAAFVIASGLFVAVGLDRIPARFTGLRFNQGAAPGSRAFQSPSQASPAPGRRAACDCRPTPGTPGRSP